MTKTVTAITAGILILAAILFFSFRKEREARQKIVSEDIVIERTWELPDELEEISGFDFIDESRIVAVQDEKGSIFIYNLTSSKIEKEIPFGGSGDYEGIAVKNESAYVLMSDGSVIEVKNYMTRPQTRTITTPLSRKQDIEGLTLEKNKNRLLLSVKEKEANSETKKGIYALGLKDFNFQKNAAYVLDLTQPIFEKVKQKKTYNRFQPTDLALSPTSDKIYIVEGTNPKLLVMNTQGEVLDLFILNRKEFPQPEGLAFSPNNDLYISSEGKPGLLHKISIKK